MLVVDGLFFLHSLMFCFLIISLVTIQPASTAGKQVLAILVFLRLCVLYVTFH